MIMIALSCDFILFIFYSLCPVAGGRMGLLRSLYLLFILIRPIPFLVLCIEKEIQCNIHVFFMTACSVSVATE